VNLPHLSRRVTAVGRSRRPRCRANIHPVITPSLRAAAARQDALLAARLDTIVPELMARAGLDAWVLVSGEYAEDPVLATMLPATWLGTARRLTILVFLRHADDTVRRLAVARYAVGDVFAAAWDPAAQPDQLTRLGELLAEGDPHRIGLDVSSTFPLADGLTAGSRDAILAALPHDLAGRVVSAESAAIGWLETRLPEEQVAMADACRESHGYLRRALSAEVIVPAARQLPTSNGGCAIPSPRPDAARGSTRRPACRGAGVSVRAPRSPRSRQRW